MYQIHSILFGYFVISGWPESKGVVILPKRYIVIEILVCNLKKEGEQYPNSADFSNN